MSVCQYKGVYTMNETRTSSRFLRRPLSSTAKLTIGVFLVNALLCGIFGLLLGLPDGLALLSVTAVLVICSGLMLPGLRWASLLGAAFCGFFIIPMLTRTPFPVYHLTHPKPEFLAFVLDVLILALFLMGLIAGLYTTVMLMVGIVVGAILIAGIAEPVVSANTPLPSGVPAVHMGLSTFGQSTVTISKGSKLLLIDDGSYFHILANGSWENGSPHTVQESGAPTVNNVQVTGGSIEIGPFNTAGTYHIYCTVHQGMMLTIIVQ